ncbi:class I SAM-dependent methyltransferase [Deltaproteobacteria bacterium OttesenSCG-928-K17]|nr:class I SAM-dependent methyltransferase [Deltaproteobacteria bacterium OttesenSCG-928-K17]
MKENKYDGEKFFKEYSLFPRSVEGLNAAGEWHELKKLLPDFKKKRVLDIGCGFGWHCIYAAEQGASYVLGTDISEKMLAVAKEKTAAPNVEYRLLAMEDIDFPAGSFDIALSSLAFHYTADFSDICKRVYRCLASAGAFVFSVEHPVFTAQGGQDWIYDSENTPAHWPVDNYFMEGKREALFLGERITKYHKTLTTYLSAVLQTGFSITNIIEPQPAKHLLDTAPAMRDELRRPMMLLVSAVK